MAEKLNTKSAPTKDNQKAQDDIIKECAAEFKRIDAARKELNDEAKEVRKRLKNIGIDHNAFRGVEKLRDMEQEARNKYMEDLTQVYSVLGISGQLDWVSAIPEPTEAE